MTEPSQEALSSIPAVSEADRLKTEGNALYAQGKYKAAYRKYSEAIKEEPKNAVYWCNRAACSLALKQYLDGITDAQKAAQLDSSYAKAWSRLATGLEGIANWDKAVYAWTLAVSSLPEGDKLSEQDKKLKEQFQESLRKAQACKDRGAEVQEKQQVSISIKDAPFNRALAMEKDVEGKVSSVDKDWQYGLEGLNEQTEQKFGAKVLTTGRTGVLADLSNAILRDYRVFHVSTNKFFDQFSGQISVEAQSCGAWLDVGPKKVMKEAPQRLRKSGWDDLRMALAVTVRVWITDNFMKNTIQGIPFTEFYRNAIEVLEWGRKTFKSVSRNDRGPIFDDTFLRGVKRLYLRALMNQHSTQGADGSTSLQEIADLAQALVNEVKQNPYDDKIHPPGLDLGFWQSFWPNIEGEARATLGWYHMKLAGTKITDPEEARSSYVQSAFNYNEAANCFAKDDECHIYYLKLSLEAFWFAGVQLTVTLDLCRRIREAYPDVKKIWEHSQFAPQLARHLEQVLSFETKYRYLLEEGKVTLDETAHPPEIVPVVAGDPLPVTKH